MPNLPLENFQFKVIFFFSLGLFEFSVIKGTFFFLSERSGEQMNEFIRITNVCFGSICKQVGQIFLNMHLKNKTKHVFLLKRQ